MAIRLKKLHTTAIDINKESLVLTLKYREKLDKNSKYVPFSVLKKSDPLASQLTLGSYVTKEKVLTGK